MRFSFRKRHPDGEVAPHQRRFGALTVKAAIKAANAEAMPAAIIAAR
jgi:hypothetical protein